MEISLTPELENFVEESVASGRYGSASEMVVDGLRKLEEEQRWVAYAKERIQAGREDQAAGRVVDGETAMRRIRAAAQSPALSKAS